MLNMDVLNIPVRQEFWHIDMEFVSDTERFVIEFASFEHI